MGFIVWVLILGALIAAIWGRRVAQGFVSVVLGGAAVLLGLLTVIVGVLLFITPPANMGHQTGDWDSWHAPGEPPAVPRPAAASVVVSSPFPVPAAGNTSPGVPAVAPAPPPTTVVRPRVGIITRGLTPEEDAAIGLRPGIGQGVTFVAPGSGAAAGGMVPGDAITKVYVRGAWYWVVTPADITRAVESSPAGSVTYMEVARYGRIYRVGLRSALYRVTPTGP